MSKRYEFVLKSITDKIADGTYCAGSQLPTENQMTQMYNVSRITIQKAMNILASQNIIERVAGRGTFVKDNSEPIENDADRSLYAFVSPNVSAEMSDIIKGAQDLMLERGHYLTLGVFDNNVQKERNIVEKFISDGVKGLIVALWDSNTNKEFYQNLIEKNFPIVFIDKSVNGTVGNVVLSNNVEGINSGVSYLIEMGHKKIGYISFPISISDSLNDRITAYVTTMKKNNLEVNPSRFCITGHEEAFDKIDTMFKKNPDMTAVMCASDSLALHIYSYANKMGINIPNDLSVCSFDGYDYTDLMLPPLTTVKQDFQGIARRAAELLLESCNERTGLQRKIYVPTTLIIRESVKNLKG